MSYVTVEFVKHLRELLPPVDFHVLFFIYSVKKLYGEPSHAWNILAFRGQRLNFLRSKKRLLAGFSDAQDVLAQMLPQDVAYLICVLLLLFPLESRIFHLLGS